MVNKASYESVLEIWKNNERVITGLKRISKPGLRVYAKQVKFLKY